MNQKEVIRIIKQIHEKNVNKNICIFIDGDWGIGKTYSINSLINTENNEELIFKYISVFGKSDIEQIEKDLILQLMTVSNKVSKLRENNLFKLFGNVVSEGLKIGGIELNFGDLLNNLKIENVSLNKFKGRVILCIDDIERKSPNVDIKDLLGLIERSSINFNVIFIANSGKLGEDKETFIEYKEKLVDFQYTLDQIDLDTLEKIAQSSSNGFDNKTVKLISQVYYNVSITDKKNGSRFKNIRIFKKCIELLDQINELVRANFPHDHFEIDNEIIKLSMKVIDDQLHSNTEEDKKSVLNTHYKKMMYETFLSIFLHENFNYEVLKNYLVQNSEITNDISELTSSYKMNEAELNHLLTKINKNIDEKNLSYFKEPNLVVSLYDVLNKIEEREGMSKKLLAISSSLYVPSVIDGPLILNNEDWLDDDYMGYQTENLQTSKFIRTLNSKNEEAYDEYIKQEYSRAISETNISELSNLIRERPLTDKLSFEKMFNLAFEKLIICFEDEVWRFIYTLMNTQQDSDYVRQFINDKIKCTSGKSIKLKLLKLLKELDEIEYYENLYSDNANEDSEYYSQ